MSMISKLSAGQINNCTDVLAFEFVFKLYQVSSIYNSRKSSFYGYVGIQSD